MPSLDETQVRIRILNNARAAEWERLRNEALKLWPGLNGEELEDKARELQREKLTAAGRKGAETYRRRAEQQRTFQTLREQLLEQAEVVRREADFLAAMVQAAAGVGA